MKLKYRRLFAVVGSLILLLVVMLLQTPPDISSPKPSMPASSNNNNEAALAINVLAKLAIKGRSPLTGYSREEFGNGWRTLDGCDTRNIILHRDLADAIVNDSCQVISGMLNDPYTGKMITFKRGAGTSDDIQIDHVVALADAWQTGAWQLDKNTRIMLANDPLELLAVDGPANQQKGGANAASWLPSNKSFRCQYVARQVAVKEKYDLWMTQSEHDAVARVLASCPQQAVPAP